MAITVIGLDWNLIGGWAAVTLLLSIALTIPGYALLLYVAPLSAHLTSWLERLIAALGIGVLLTPVVFLAARLVGLLLGGPILIGGLLAALAAIALKQRWLPIAGMRLPLGAGRTSGINHAVGRVGQQGVIYHAPTDDNAGRVQPAPTDTIHNSKLKTQNSKLAFTVLVIFIVGLAVRVHQAWGEAAALGSDGYHHTLISQLIIEQRGIPRDYLPYAPLTSFTYHYGFHALVAISYWLGGWAMFGVGPLATAKLTLMVGQIISAMSALSAYLLAAVWLRSRLAGVVAALVTLVSVFPTYYLDWGRDTQMAGLLGLPILLIVTTMILQIDATDNSNLKPQTSNLILLAGVLAAGLFLTHYRIIIAYAYFVGIFWLVQVVASLLDPQARAARVWLRLTARVVAMGTVALVVVSPWLFNLLGGFSFTLQTGSKLPAQSFFSTKLSTIVDGWWANTPLLALSAAGWIFGILYRNRYVISIGLLTATLLILSSPYFINVPFLSGRVDYQTVISMLWLPQGVLVGYLALALWQMAQRRLPLPATITYLPLLLAVVVAILTAIPLWDAREADPLESYLLPADVQGLQWVAQHTEYGSLFLTNTFTWSWAPNSRAGSDGGLWLPLLAGGKRTATAPPLPYNNERATDPNYRAAVLETSRAAAHVDEAQAVDYLRSIGVKYAYIGARATALSPPNLSRNPNLVRAREADVLIGGNLDPAQFQRTPQSWRQVYAQDGVFVFKLRDCRTDVVNCRLSETSQPMRGDEESVRMAIATETTPSVTLTPAADAAAKIKLPLVSIIIPAYNEEAHIEQVLRRIVVLDFDKQVVVVDDGSQDHTPELLHRWEDNPQVTVVYAPQNRGKGAAIRLGLQYTHGDIIMVHDADLEYRPEEMRPLLELIATGQSEVVYGSRFSGKIKGMAFKNWLANRILALAANVLFRARITDEATAYKAFRAEVLKSIPLRCERFEFCPEVTAKVRKRGYKIMEVPITYEGRTALQGKKIKMRDGFEALWTLIKYRFID